MSGSMPQRAEGTQFTVTLPSVTQQDILTANSERITRYLRQQLHNDYITLSFVCNETGDGPHQAYSPREKFEEMKKDNPDPLNALVSAFGLEFA